MANKRIIFIILVTWGFFFSGKIDHYSPPSSREIIDQMLKAVDNVKTLTYHLKVNERIKGTILSTQSVVKLQRSPRKLYLFLYGPEVLWIEGKNNGNALVNPGAFPFFSLNLDPYGATLRKDQHHTIHEVGFDYLSDIIRASVKKTGDKFDRNFLFIGEEKGGARACYKIIITYPEFAFNNYTVKKGEDLVAIARKFKISEYMILENNPAVDNFSNVKEGQQIKIPNAYGKLTTLLIDKEYLLPIFNKIFDDKGLFESYEYQELKVNVKIPEEEFTKEFKGYHFKNIM